MVGPVPICRSFAIVSDWQGVSIDRPAEPPDPIALDVALRESIVTNLEAHDRREVPLDGRRHAGVAVLIVDSVAGSDADDPHRAAVDDVAVIPSGAAGLDGRMAGVAGVASFVLCLRSAG
ncbi:MAG: hypothetical protein ACR2O6_01065, partial [Ilumatobacteraceae bacterium]